MTDFESHAVLPKLVGKPGYSKRRMAEYACGQAGLLDFAIAVHDPSDPAQIHIHGPDRSAADHNARGGAVVCDRVKDLARVLYAGVYDFERRHYVFGGAQHIRDADAWPLERFAKNEGELDLDSRRAIVGMGHLGAIGDHHIVKQMTVVRLVDLRRLLHGLRSEERRVGKVVMSL